MSGNIKVFGTLKVGGIKIGNDWEIKPDNGELLFNHESETQFSIEADGDDEPQPTPQPTPTPEPQPQPTPTPEPQPQPTPTPEPQPQPTPTPVQTLVSVTLVPRADNPKFVDIMVDPSKLINTNETSNPIGGSTLYVKVSSTVLFARNTDLFPDNFNEGDDTFPILVPLYQNIGPTLLTTDDTAFTYYKWQFAKGPNATEDRLYSFLPSDVPFRMATVYFNDSSNTNYGISFVENPVDGLPCKIAKDAEVLYTTQESFQS